MVLLKELAPAGYAVFYTNYGSRKARELDRERGRRQLCSIGRSSAARFVSRAGRESPAEESDAYFATRPWRSQLNAWSSRQSRPLADPAELEQRARDEGARARRAICAVAMPAPNAKSPRPDSWGGFRLWFDTVELWARAPTAFTSGFATIATLSCAATQRFRPSAWTWQRLQP